MDKPIRILVGTMTGTAELVAEEIAEVLSDAGVENDIALMDDLDAGSIGADRAYIICTSTYGNGDVPDNAQALFDALESDRPDLSDVRYGVFCLGDSTYQQTFCFGGKKFDDLFGALGATRIGDRMEHNASAGSLPEDEAAGWAADWHALYAAV